MQRVIHSVLTSRILLNLRQAVRANEIKPSLETVTLDFEAGNGEHEVAEAGMRTRQRSSRSRSIQWQNSNHSIFISYLGTIFSLDSETWTHDEESAMRSENEDGRTIPMVTLSSSSRRETQSPT